MTKLLSDLNNSLTFVPSSLSPAPAGLIMSHGGSTVPEGWLEADGTAVSRSTYADLFAAISTTYGVGDGSTTFNLPAANYQGLLKEYSEGGSDFTVTGTNWTTTSAIFTPKKDADGNWSMDVLIDGSFSSSGTTTLTLSGITARTGSIQPLYEYDANANTVIRCRIDGGTNTVDVVVSSMTGLQLAGNLLLDSKPSWADDNGISIIKAYPDSSSISMSIKDATATDTGAVRLSSDFAATETAYGFAKTSDAGDATEQYLIPRYQTTTVTLDNDFTGGELDVKVTRIGDVVTITGKGVATHASSALRESSAGLIPDWARPTTEIWNSHYNDGSTQAATIIESDGTVKVDHSSARTDTIKAINISYVIV